MFDSNTAEAMMRVRLAFESMRGPTAHCDAKGANVLCYACQSARLRDLYARGEYTREA